MIEQTVSHYKILEKLGEGGMGEVYLAEDTKLDRKVALKFLPGEFTKDKDARERFKREAKAAAALNHPNIVTIYEINEHEGRTYIAMEYVEGMTLRDRIASPPLPLGNIIEVASQICRGLAAAHDRGIVHRDIKPANIMATEGGEVKILDFGLAKLRGASKFTREGTTLGTVAYMSPEQAAGEDADPRSDIWSLGVIMYEMTTGQVPFQGEYEQAVMYAIMNEEPAPVTGLRSGIPLQLDRIIEKSLSKDLSERYQSVAEMTADLKRLGKTTSTGRATVEPSVAEKDRRSLKRLLIAGLCSMIGVIIAGYFILKDTSRPDETTPSSAADIRKTTVTEWKNSVAVLPFTDLSPARDQEYFCDGMTEQIITNLSRVPDLKVIARTSVMVYKNSPKDIREISRELGVEYVLEGSVRKAGSQVRVTAQLINAADGFHIWAEDYDRELNNIFEIQDDVSRSLAEALEGTVVRRNQNASPYPANIEAYDWYLKAQYHVENIYLKTRSEDDFQKAVEMARKAIELDPDWAQGYVAMAYIHENRWVVTGDDRDLKQEKEYAEKAREVDPESAAANASSALQHLRGGDADTAFSRLKKALQLNPNSANALHIMAMLYESIGLQDRALIFAQRVVELNPKKVYGLNHAAWHSSAVGKFDQAVLYYDKALDLQPDFVPSLNGCAFALLMKNDLRSAQALLDRARPLLGKVQFFFNEIQALAHARRGEREAALSLAETALVYVVLGDYEKAFAFLERLPNTDPAAATIFYCYPGLKNLTVYDPVRRHPRFKAVVEKRRRHYQKLAEKYAIDMNDTGRDT